MNNRPAGLRWVLGFGCLLVVLAFATAGCSSGQDTLGPESNASDPGAQTSSAANHPCSDDLVTEASCEPRDVSAIDLFSGLSGSGALYIGEPASTLEEVLEKGLELAEASPVHLAARGTADAGSVRCDWRGIARSPAQRELAIRFWLGLDADDALPDGEFLEALFTATFDVIGPAFQETVKSNFLAIAEGGLSEDYLFLTCYADYAASEYLLGAGPTSLILAYDRMGEAHSYDLYRREHDAGQFGEEPLASQGEYESWLLGIVAEAEQTLIGQIGGRESVVFLAPMGAHNAIAVEAWMAVDQWDLQTDDDDVVHAVRYGVPEGDPEHTLTLANLESRITTASTTDDFADDRIENASGLTQSYRDMGAYGDITPGDGQTATFTPSQPPPALTCASGSAVTSPETNRGLVHDCEALLAAKDTLRGTATLDWAADSAITGWEGITTGGTPSRVTELDLSSESLSGSIPAGLGNLFELTSLDLSSNSLSGDIPSELGWLYKLTEIRLSGNSLTGCIPIALEDVATNDLSSLSLLYCKPPVPGAPTAGTVGATSVPLSWTAVSNTSKYRVGYRGERASEWSVDDDAVTGTTHTVDELLCGTEYRFRVSAYGSGTTYAAEWSDPSEVLTASTEMCVPPVFGATSYSFRVVGDASLETVVGIVSATDGGSTVTYAVTAGNEDGLFAIEDSSGEITVAADLSGEAGTTVTLTVAARKDMGGEATVPVVIAITETCDSGTAVPNPSTNTGLVADCKTLLGLQSALEGTATLNWSVDRAMTNWDGLTLGGTPQRVTRLVLEREGLTGSIPAAVGDLAGLKRLRLGLNDLTGSIPDSLGRLTELEYLGLSYNELTGPIPVELGALTNLGAVYLHENELTGTIPSELGNLTEVYDLWLQDNDLTGPIPPELGNLTEVERLWLSENELSGVIPAEMTKLTRLTLLLLYGNDLEGCVPPSLRDVDLNDLDSLRLSDCQEGPAAPVGFSASLTGGTFSLNWTATSGVDEYEVQWQIDDSGTGWEALPAVPGASATYTPTGGPQCSSTYEFRVRAHGDGYTYATHWGPESDPETVDTLSCPPEFDQASYAFDVAEDAEVDDVLGMVSATDPDMDDTLSYAITAGNTGTVFDIDDETGEITITGALDHEVEPSYSLTVEADDGNGQTDTVTVTITVTDVAEDAPPAPGSLDATLSSGTFTLTWDAVTGAVKYEAQHTTDAADAATVTWTALAETTGRTQDYTPAGGVTCSTEYRFRVRAFGDGDTYTAMWGTESSPDTVETESCPPEFDEASYAFDVAEDAEEDYVVGMVSATDPDMDDDVSYAITAGNTGSAFDIDDETGEIKVATALDFEAEPSYSLEVEADDGNEQTDTVMVAVSVTDVAEDAPPVPGSLYVTLSSGTFTLTWDAVTGAVKYEAQHTTDATDAATVTWTALTETTGTTQDYTPVGGVTCSTEYRFRVRAFGDGESYAAGWGAESGAETVETESCPPEFDEASYAFDVAEDAEVDDVVGMVSATDPDMDDTVSYAITAGNTGTAFDIDDETGEINVAGALDHEAEPSYSLEVEADDGNGQTDTVMVTITVTDVAEDAPPVPMGLTANLADGTFSISWSAVSGAAKYEAQHTTDAANAETVTWTSLAETTGTTQDYTPVGGVTCSTEYRFRVRAFGDGDTYTAMWGTESTPDTVETASCDPEFGQASYDFFILDTAATDSDVGDVSATDPDTDDTVSYAITGGNDDGKFSINVATGQLRVAGTEAFNLAQTPYYTLTVEASDGNGGKGTAKVTVSLTIAECHNGTVVPRPDEFTRLVRDCSVLLTAKDTLRGTGDLNWSANTNIREWQGIFTGWLNPRVPLDVSTIHVKDLIVSRLGLNGTIPSVLAGLVDLHRLDLDDNALTGEIPASLGQIESLELLHLLGNRLTGEIPAELGNLSNLRILSLYANDLTGNIPSELGKLTNLEQLLLDDNDFTGQLPSELANITGLERLFVRESRLTGEIPAWLASLDELEYLYLEGNDFTGCIPAGLRDVDNHDFDRMGLADCST